MQGTKYGDGMEGVKAHGEMCEKERVVWRYKEKEHRVIKSCVWRDKVVGRSE